MSREAVVFVHGLWQQGPESLLLRRRLAAEFGYDVRAFRYPSVHASMEAICAGLAEFAGGIGAERLHFVGHSLGGVVIHRTLARLPLRPGRVVFLGSPVAGSRAAVGAARWRWTQPLMGRAVAEELLVPHERRWSDARPLGIIAGTRGAGLGDLFAHFGEPNDGVVAVSETRLPGAADHITLPVGHLGLLLSARAARQTGTFLREGRFALVP